jgi:hypothetical protein
LCRSPESLKWKSGIELRKSIKPLRLHLEAVICWIGRGPVLRSISPHPILSSRLQRTNNEIYGIKVHA